MSKQEQNQQRNWYAIHTYAGYENAVLRNLRQRIDSLGMEDKIFNVIVPTEKKIKIKAGKRVETEEKIYPGYILVDMIVTDDSWFVVRNTPRVTGFVGAGVNPVPLKKEEVDFLRHHRSYDRCVSIVSLIQTLMLHFYGEGKWLNHLRAFINSNESRPERMTPFLESKIKAYAPIAFRLSEFYQQLDTETKSVIYPAEALEQTLKEIDDGCN